MSCVVAIVGPTASGKSAVADLLASRIQSEVLSADSMQVYKRMNIGTAKMGPSDCTVPLRLVDLVEPDVPYSAACYQKDARREIDRLLSDNKTPVVCGGTGLYLRAALDVMDFPSGEIGTAKRSRYQELANTLGADGLHALLASRDHRSAAVIHPHNTRRVVRALEMLDEGTCYADQKEGFSTPEPYYDTVYFGLTMDRSRLYDRINRRVDIMFEQGLVDEVRGLVNDGYANALTSMQAIGYKEVIDALNGDMTLSEAKELIKMRSRRYAKRQLSWFKRDARVHWIDMDALDTEHAVATISDELSDGGHGTN